MAENYNIESKVQTTFRLDKNLYDDLNNYSNIKGISKSEAMNEIIFKYFKGKILTNTYLTNVAGLSLNIPLDLEFKKNCIKNGLVLNKDNSSESIGNKTIRIRINKIPNNLDVFIMSDGAGAGGYESNRNGILHEGIDFIFTGIDVLSKPTIKNDKLDIDVMDCLYCFYFEVNEDNTTNVYLIDHNHAVNELSKANDRIIGDKLVDMMEALEEIQQQVNYNYNIRIENLNATNKNVTDHMKLEIVDTTYMELLEAITELSTKKMATNENIKLPKINKNTPTRVIATVQK